MTVNLVDEGKKMSNQVRLQALPRAVGVICFIAIVTTLYSIKLYLNDPVECHYSKKDIGKYINCTFEQIDNSPIRVLDLEIPFKWDEMCVYTPYTLSPRVGGPTNNGLTWHKSQMYKFNVPGYHIIGEVPNLDNDGLWAVSFKDSNSKTIRFVEIVSYRGNKKNECFNRNVRVKKSENLLYFN